MPTNPSAPINEKLATLLRNNQLSAVSGNILSSWRMLTTFATDFWLTSPTDVPDELRGDYFSLAAAAADHLGLADEAIDSLHRLRDWGKTHEDQATALVALAQLAQQALDAEASDLFSLPETAELLRQFATEFDDWRPHPDSLTIGEEPQITWKEISPEHAARLELAAMIAYTVSCNIVEDPGIPALREHFATQVRRFGRHSPTDADQRLWRAQDLWVTGKHDDARDVVTTLVKELEYGDNPVAEYEANDMLGTFDMFDAARADDEQVETYLRQLHQHWSRCVDIAMKHGVPVIALKRAALVAQNLLGFGTAQDAETAATLTKKMLAFCEGVPMSPVVLDLVQVSADAALATGEYRFAYKQAYDGLSWSEFTNDTARTAALAHTAAESAVRSGDSSAASDMFRRHAEIQIQREQWHDAAHSLQQLAEYTSDIAPLAEARELLDKINYRSAAVGSAAESSSEENESHDSMSRDWEFAHWHWKSALVLMTHGEPKHDKAVHHIEEASRLFAESGDLFMAADCARQQTEYHLEYNELSDAELSLRHAWGWMHDLVLFTQGLTIPPEGLPQAMQELNDRLHRLDDMLGR